MELELSTTKCLYKSRQVTIDGKLYTCRKLDKKTLEKIYKLDEDASNGDMDAPFEEAHFAFGIPLIILHKLAAAEVGAINKLIRDDMTNPEKHEKGPEKNASGSGDKK